MTSDRPTSEQSGEAPSPTDLVTPPYTLRLVWLVLPVGLALVGFGLLPLRSWDYWWHVTIGRLVSRWQAVPAANHFLYTLEGSAPSLFPAWLAEWVLYELHRPASVYGTLLVRNVLVGGAFIGLTVAAIRRSGSVLAGSLSALIGLFFALGFVEVRPHLLAWPLFLGLLWVGYRVRGGDGSLWTLAAFPTVAALWGNLHGSFLLAAAVGLAFGAARTLDRWRTDADAAPGREFAWYGAAAASLVAPLLNPRGLDLYRYVLSQATDPVVRSTITEWWPTTPWHPPALGALFYVTLAALGWLTWRYREKLDPADALLWGGLALLSLTQSRALLWYGFAFPVVASPYLAPLVKEAEASKGSDEDERPGRVAQALHLGLAVALLVAGLAVQPVFRWRIDWTADTSAFEVRQSHPFKGVVPDETPVEAMQWLRQQGVRRHLYHDHRFAGFLLFHLTDAKPNRLVFVDHRVELPPPSIWDRYHAVNRQKGLWRKVFSTYDVGAAVLSVRHQERLIEQLEAASGWKTVVETDGYALFLET